MYRRQPAGDCRGYGRAAKQASGEPDLGREKVCGVTDIGWLRQTQAMATINVLVNGFHHTNGQPTP